MSSQSQSIVELRNALVCFSFDTRTGSLVGIEDRKTGQQHLNDAKRGRLFRIICPSPTWAGRHADSHTAAPPSIERDGQRLTLVYDRLQTEKDEMAVEVTVTVELPEDSAEARFHMKLVNRDENRMHEVRFPWVSGWTGLAGRSKDEFRCGVHPIDPYPPTDEVFKMNLGNIHRRRYLFYNNTMLLPICDLSGSGKGGLSYINYQTAPHIGGVAMENLDPEPGQLCYSFGWTHLPFTRHEESWESPVIGIGVHQWDWHATADRYRDWTRTWWKPASSTKRLRESIGGQFVQLRRMDGGSNRPYSDLPKIAAEGLKYGVEDLCLFVDPATQQYIRPDDGEYWESNDPQYSMQKLKSAAHETTKLGVNLSVLVNYRLVRAMSSLYRRIGEDQVQRTVAGAPMHEDYSHWSIYHGDLPCLYLSSASRALCQKHPDFQARAIELTRETLDMGFRSVFIDQTFDFNPCLATHHGHDSPDDTHIAALDWTARAVEMIRQGHPEAYIMGEVPDVFGMQYTTVAWHWKLSPETAAAMRYTLPDALLYWVVDHQREVMNRLFAAGCLAAFTTGMTEKTLGDYPAFAEHVAALVKLRKQTAPWLMYGRFLDTIGLTVDGAAAYVFDSDAGLAVAVADVEQSGFEKGHAKYVRITLDPRAHNREPSGGSTLTTLSGESVAPDVKAADGILTLETDLAPGEVAVWTVPCNARITSADE